ncbi:hypothetical protein M8J75_001752 [Diaphorina citri]|nr:hypothetical protein M8J75_001752 [Diaphorina citri]
MRRLEKSLLLLASCLQGDYLKLFLHVEDGEVNEYTSWSNLLCGKSDNVPQVFYSSGPGLVLEFHTDEHDFTNSTGFIGTFKFLEKRLAEVRRYLNAIMK